MNRLFVSFLRAGPCVRPATSCKNSVFFSLTLFQPLKMPPSATNKGQTLAVRPFTIANIRFSSYGE